MKKPFYKDVLAAAWMARNYGMTFTSEEGKLYDWAVEIQLPLERYYIHPDSLHLLSLSPGDVIEWTNKGKAANRWSDVADFQDGYSAKDALTPFQNQNYKIIQRGDINFMWPESEE